jgi:thiamine biosynthesis lipoprotein
VTTTAATAFRALGTTAVVVVDDSADDPDSCRRDASAAVERTTAAFDLACSRFRDDSELMGLRRSHGRPIEISPLLYDALDAALRAARLTDGLVDPTIGGPLRALGYDRDFSFVSSGDQRTTVHVSPAPGFRSIELDPIGRTVTVPRGIDLDLGATAKALCVDHAARSAHESCGIGVLVGIGGDFAMVGTPPTGGWTIQLADDHAAELDPGAPAVAVFGGGVATSGTTVRRWSRAGEPLHHLVDPATGRPVAEVWKTATVVAGSCLDANTASTASILLGGAAVDWLDGLGLPARLVTPDDDVVTVGPWPSSTTHLSGED